MCPFHVCVCELLNERMTQSKNMQKFKDMSFEALGMVSLRLDTTVWGCLDGSIPGTQQP